MDMNYKLEKIAQAFQFTFFLVERGGDPSLQAIQVRSAF